MEKLSWKTEKRFVRDLIPYPHNPRKIDKKQRQELTESLEKFNLVEIPAINMDNVLIAGHQRVAVLASLGRSEEEIDVRVPNRLLTEDELKEYNVRSNKNTGDWDFDILKGFFKKDDLCNWGFNKKEIEFNFNAKQPEVKKIPEEKTVVDGNSEVGDLWALEEHRLLCGDSTNIKNIEAVLCGNEYDVLIFDPPYEIEDLYQTAMQPYQEGKKLLIFWDFKRFATAARWPVEFGWAPQYEFIWDCVTSWYTPNRPLARHKACGYYAKDPFFDFDKAIIHDGKERKAGIVHNTRGECDYRPLDGAVHIRTVESFPNASEGDIHKHGKPVQWITAIFNGIGGEKYLDLFGGGGTTLCVCEALRRTSYTIELNPQNCNAIISRWEEMTGKKAELLNRNV